MDLVFLWVNGEDPLWRESFEKHGGRSIGSDEIRQRYTSVGELKYALRSVEKHAPWINRIFIVHDDIQTPRWLDVTHPKITLVPHSAFIPRAYLPTFNSCVIESFVHQISGLSEKFICANDDFLFVRNCRPEDFFRGELAIIHFSEYDCPTGDPVATDPPWRWGFKNADRLLPRSSEPRKSIAHGHYPCRVSVAREAWSRFEKPLTKHAEDKFRAPTSIAFINHLVPHLLLYEGRGVPSKDPFVELREIPAEPRIIRLIRAVKRWRHPWKNILAIWRRTTHPPQILCLNKGSEQAILEVLEEYFPKPSQFEVRPPEALAARVA